MEAGRLDGGLTRAVDEMAFVWIALFVVGIVVAVMASRRAVGAALEVSDALGVSSGLVGLTVLAIGTDLPEIANSISAALSGHGDLALGDATGSALTQITLILAILLLAGGTQFDLRGSGSKIAITTGAATVVALVVLAAFLSNGKLGRVEGLILVGGWVVGLIVIHRREGGGIDVPDHHAGVGVAVVRTLGWLLVVGGASTVVVRSFVVLSDRVGAPEFIASALVLSIGTSMPELVVDWTAIRRHASALAIGDLFGSSLVDSTLAVGIGPIVRPIAVSEQTMTGALVIAVGCALATAAVSFAGAPRRTAWGLLAIYVGSSAALVAMAT